MGGVGGLPGGGNRLCGRFGPKAAERAADEEVAHQRISDGGRKSRKCWFYAAENPPQLVFRMKKSIDSTMVVLPMKGSLL